MKLPLEQTVQANLEAESILHRISNRIRQSLELTEILAATAAEVRSLLGTDRVKIYKFHPDESGQVVAESLDEQRLPSLLGLNFPAGDIPPHARELYLKSRVRSVINTQTQEIGYSHLEELSDGTIHTDEIRYRQLDPCHQEYMTAMGVMSSVIVPIMDREHLWGLLASHHSDPRTILPNELQLLQGVVDQLSVAIAHSELLARAEEKAQLQTCINRINSFLHTSDSIDLQPALEEAISALKGSGGRLCIKGNPYNASDGTIKTFLDCLHSGSVNVYSWGKQPRIPEWAQYPLMEQYSVWQSHYRSGKYDIWEISDIFQVDALRNLQAAFFDTKIRSMLMIPLQYRQELFGFLSIFRDEFETETLWAGQVDNDKRLLSPRISFEVWRDTKRTAVPKWADSELELASSLRTQFSTALYQHEMRYQLKMFNANLEAQVQQRTTQLEQAVESVEQGAMQQRVLFDVVSKMRDSLNLETIFRTTTKEVCKALAIERVSVYRFNEDWGGEFVGDFEFVHPNWANLAIGVNTVWNDTYLQETEGGRYRHGESFAVNDVRQANLTDCHVDVLNQFQIKSFLTAPIFVGQRLWGILGVYQHSQPRKWQDSEVQFVTQVAVQLGVAIQQAELLMRTQQQTIELQQAADNLRAAEQQQVLFDVVTKMRESLDVPKIFKTATRETGRVLNTDRVVVFQFNKDWGGEFVGDYEFVTAQWQHLNFFNMGQWNDACLQETQGGRFIKGELLCVDDIHTFGHAPCYVEVLQQLQVKAYLITPIFVGSQLWGLLAAYQHSSPRHWQPLEVGFFSQVGAQLGVAVQQADLLAQTQSQAEQLSQTLNRLQNAQTQLVQTEKMSSLGQLVAGVAHEINNPVSFIHGNLTPLSDYADNLLELLSLYQQYYPNPEEEIAELAEDIDIAFLRRDLPQILSSMKMGTDRICEIVRSLQNFSRLDQAEMKSVDLHEGIDSTLLILQSRLKGSGEMAEIEVVKDYGNLPKIDCYPGQLNQVFMNLINNAIDAIREKYQLRSLQEQQANPGRIQIRTELISKATADHLKEERIFLQFSDNGGGMTKAICERIFDPFFTTKAVGKGTGLGLSISYQTIVEQHGGSIECYSTPNTGTAFRIEIPIQQIGRSCEIPQI
jgi:GAF domain-containing protein